MLHKGKMRPFSLTRRWSVIRNGTHSCIENYIIRNLNYDRAQIRQKNHESIKEIRGEETHRAKGLVPRTRFASPTCTKKQCHSHWWRYFSDSENEFIDCRKLSGTAVGSSLSPSSGKPKLHQIAYFRQCTYSAQFVQNILDRSGIQCLSSPWHFGCVSLRLSAKPVEKNVKSKTCRDLTARHGFETGLWVNTSMPRDLQRPLNVINIATYSFNFCTWIYDLDPTVVNH